MYFHYYLWVPMMATIKTKGKNKSQENNQLKCREDKNVMQPKNLALEHIQYERREVMIGINI